MQEDYQKNTKFYFIYSKILSHNLKKLKLPSLLNINFINISLKKILEVNTYTIFLSL